MKAEAVEAGKVSEPDRASADRTRLLADIHLLLTLTRELKAERAKCTPNTLSLGMIKKAEDIQKLAAVVKLEMAKVQ